MGAPPSLFPPNRLHIFKEHRGKVQRKNLKWHGHEKVVMGSLDKGPCPSQPRRGSNELQAVGPPKESPT